MRRLIFFLLIAGLAACGEAPSGPPAPGAPKGKGAAPAESSPAAPPAWVGFELRRGQSPRELVRIGLRGVVIGSAEGRLEWKLFAEPRRSDDAWYLLSTYAPFKRSAPEEGELVFRGRGKVKPGPAEQRMIFEWVRQVASEAGGGRSGAAYGLLLAWHQGGASGLCEDVVLYLTGEAVATACGWEREVRGRLDPSQLNRIFGWFDRLQAFQTAGEPAEESSRPGGIETRLIFAGRGTKPATAAEQSEIRSFADALFTELAARRRGAAPAPAETSDQTEPTPLQHLLLPRGAASPRSQEIILQLPEKPPPVPKTPRPGVEGAGPPPGRQSTTRTSQGGPIMKRIELSTASKPLSEYADGLDDEVVILISEDRPVAAIVPLRNVDPESLSLSTDEVFLDLVEQARAEVKAGKTISFEEMKRSVLP
jgi:hypothetical protein